MPPQQAPRRLAHRHLRRLPLALAPEAEAPLQHADSHGQHAQALLLGLLPLEAPGGAQVFHEAAGEDACEGAGAAHAEDQEDL